MEARLPLFFFLQSRQNMGGVLRPPERDQSGELADNDECHRLIRCLAFQTEAKDMRRIKSLEHPLMTYGITKVEHLFELKRHHLMAGG